MTTYKLLIQAVAGGTIYTSPILSNAPAIYAAIRREIRQFTTSDFVLDQLPNTYKIDFAWDICPLDWARQMLYLDKNKEYSLTWVGSDHKTKSISKAKIYLTVIPSAQYTDKRSVRITATILEPLIPTTLFSAYAWYRASSLALNDGDSVLEWSDISGNNRHLIAENGAQAFTFRENQLDVYPAVQALGTGTNNLVIQNNTSILDRCTVLQVFKLITSAGASLLYESSGGLGYYMGLQNQQVLLLNGGGIALGVNNELTMQYQQVGFRYNRGNYEFFVGSDTTTSGNNTQQGTPTNLTLGLSSLNGYSLVDMLIFDINITNTVLNNVRAYFTGRYGV
jgi:hypothetical protein